MDELENGLLRELRVVLELEFSGFAIAELLTDMFETVDSESDRAVAVLSPEKLALGELLSLLRLDSLAECEVLDIVDVLDAVAEESSLFFRKSDRALEVTLFSVVIVSFCVCDLFEDGSAIPATACGLKFSFEEIPAV